MPFSGSNYSQTCFRFFISLLGIILIVLAGCSAEQDSSVASQAESKAAVSAPMIPELSPELVEIFSQDCARCHINEATGAPLVGDAEAWRRILSKGIDATVERSFNGYRGMPPAGQCFECSTEQMTQLIYFMSQGA